MKVKIIRSITGAPDHLNARDYQIGEEFEVGHRYMPAFLAETLLEEGFAEEVGRVLEEKPEEKPEAKSPEPKVVASKPAGYTGKQPGRYEKKA